MPRMQGFRKLIGSIGAPEGSAGALTPLLVDSSGRSGSTMLMALLLSSPAVAGDDVHPFEHRYFAWMLEWATTADGREWDTERWNGGILAERGHGGLGNGLVGPPPWPARTLWEPSAGEAPMSEVLLATGWEAFSKRVRSRSPRPGALRYHAEKTGAAGAISRRSPIEVRALYLRRDPRDVWLSIEAFDRNRGYYGFGRRPGESGEAWLSRWLTAAAAQFVPPTTGAQTLVVRYEDLIGDRPGQLARIERWLDVDIGAAGSAQRLLDDHPEHVTSSSPDRSVGRWRTEMDPPLRERFADALGPQMQALGYEV